jgi:hypothetical protein
VWLSAEPAKAIPKQGMARKRKGFMFHDLEREKKWGPYETNASISAFWVPPEKLRPPHHRNPSISSKAVQKARVMVGLKQPGGCIRSSQQNEDQPIQSARSWNSGCSDNLGYKYSMNGSWASEA